MSYVPANQVNAPRQQWILKEVLCDNGQSSDTDGHWSLAIGEWEGTLRLAARWNGTVDRPSGNPVSRGVPTWFVMPPEFEEPLMAIVPVEKRAHAKDLLNISE